MEEKKRHTGRRAFAVNGLGALAVGLAVRLDGQERTLTEVEKNNIQVVKDWHKAMERSTAENFSASLTEDFIIDTPGLGPKPFIGRDAATKAWMDVLEKRKIIGLRSELSDFYARGPYVIATRADFAVAADGTDAGPAGAGIQGLYILNNGKIAFWYNRGVGGGRGGKKQ